MWFDAPASSSAPHFDGHHFSVVSFGGAAGWAWAEAIGASPNLPCAAPATAPAAPAIPAVFRKLQRSGGRCIIGDAVRNIGHDASSWLEFLAGEGVSDPPLTMSAASSLFDRDRSAERI